MIELSCGVCLGKSYFLCADQKGWGNPNRVPMKPCKSPGLRLQGMMEPATTLRAAETTAVWVLIRWMTYKAWRLRSIRESKEETEWWSCALLYLRQMHPLFTVHEAMDLLSPPGSRGPQRQEVSGNRFLLGGRGGKVNPHPSYFTFPGVLIQQLWGPGISKSGKWEHGWKST